MKEIYFDNSATTKVSRRAATAVLAAIRANYGNPSSLHRRGLEAEKLLTQSREKLATALSAKREEILFTSGGTESDNLAILGIANAYGKKGGHIISTAIEHPAVLEPLKRLAAAGFTVDFLQPDSEGMVAAETVAAALRPDTLLVSMMQVNNETGAIQPIAQVGKLLAAQNRKIYFHVDGVQGFGKLPTSPKALGIDLYTASGHKIHGPKGAGLLYVAKGVRLVPLVVGGGQERDIRSGTENVPGIAGFATAAEEAMEEMATRAVQMQEVRQTFLESLSKLPKWQVNGSPQGLPCVLNITFQGTKSEVLLHQLEEKGLYVSSGSACAAKKDKLSHVLTAMGMSRAAIEGALRFSFSAQNTVEEASLAGSIVTDAVTELRGLMGK